MTEEQIKQKAKEWIKDHSCLIGSYEFVKYDYDSMQKAYLAGAEPREKRIAELEEENKVLAQNLEDTEILNKTYEKRFDDLKNENAELKARVEKQNADILILKGLTERQRDQLTKAKEIIKKFLLWENDWHDKTESKYELLKQAEQFLKDSEVEK